MKMSTPFLFITLLFTSFCAQKEAPKPTVTSTPVTTNPVTTTTEDTAKKLVWSDEFDKAGLPDATKWGYDVGGSGWGNNELQYYTNDSLGNARVENGYLTIELKKQSIVGKSYSSARLNTKGKASWMYGRIEVRAKLPKGLGTWPAIWMLGDNISTATWPLCGEIDIMEHVGYDPGVINAAIHTKSFNHTLGTQKTAKTLFSDFADNFHIYKLEWNKDKIQMFVDDKAYFTFNNDGGGVNSWPFGQKFHLLLNIAFGGNWGGANGVDPNVLPAKMEIDYVRVYQ